MWFDSHCHIDSKEFADDRDGVLDRAAQAGVKRMLIVGGTSREVDGLDSPLKFAEGHDNMWATVGVHPHDASVLTDEFWQRMSELAKHPKVVAIGETGLDFFYNHSTHDEQRAAFVRFVEFARSVGKPLVCHVRDAHEAAREILQQTNAAELGTIIHCFTGTPDDAKAYAQMGLYVSFSGIATFGKNAEPIRQAMLGVPHDRLLLETDAPFLAPHPKRGKRNEPSFLPHTGAVMAKTLNLPVGEIAALTSANTNRLLGLPA